MRALSRVVRDAHSVRTSGTPRSRRAAAIASASGREARPVMPPVATTRRPPPARQRAAAAATRSARIGVSAPPGPRGAPRPTSASGGWNGSRSTGGRSRSAARRSAAKRKGRMVSRSRGSRRWLGATVPGVGGEARGELGGRGGAVVAKRPAAGPVLVALVAPVDGYRDGENYAHYRQ